MQDGARGAGPPRARLPGAARRRHQRQGHHLRLRRAVPRAPQGYRVGLYTSPHLVRVNERIQVDGARHRRRAARRSASSRCSSATRRRRPHARRTSSSARWWRSGTSPRSRWTWRCWRRAWAAGWMPPPPRGPAVTAITPCRSTTWSTWATRSRRSPREKAGIFKPGVPAVVGRAGARRRWRSSRRARARWARRCCSRAATSRWSGPVGAWRTAGPDLALDGLDARAARRAPAAERGGGARLRWSCSTRRACRSSQEAVRTGLAADALAGPPRGAVRRIRRCSLDGAHNPAGGGGAGGGARRRSTRGGRSTSSSAWWRTRTAEPMLRTLLSPRAPSRPPHARCRPRARSRPARLPVDVRAVAVPGGGRRRLTGGGRWPGRGAGRARTTCVLLHGSLFLVGEVKALARARPRAHSADGTTTHGAWRGAAPTLESMDSMRLPRTRRPRRAAHGRRGRRSGTLYRKTKYVVETADGWSLVITRYRPVPQPFRAAAVRRAAAAGARLLPEPPRLDQRASSSRTSSSSGWTSTSWSCAGHGKSSIAAPAASAPSGSGARCPPDLDYGWDIDSYFLYDLPGGGRRR